MRRLISILAVVLVFVAASFAGGVPGTAQASFQDPDGSGSSPCVPGMTYGIYVSPQWISVIRCSDGAVVAVYPNALAERSTAHSFIGGASRLAAKPPAKPPDQLISAWTGKFINRQVNVTCKEIGGGLFWVGTREIWIDQGLCLAVTAVLSGLDWPEWYEFEGVALITLAHEAIHAKGDLNEARTECKALQRTDDMARMFGVREELIPVLVGYAYVDHMHLISANHIYRNEAKCRPDGAWDLTPGDGRWP